MRAALQRPREPLGSNIPTTVPSCIGGWNARDSLAAMLPTDAVQLDNWIVRTQGVTTRLGASNWSTSGLPANDVESFLPYTGSAGAKLFAACGTALYNVTAGGAIGAAVQSGLANARWQSIVFSNSAGQYLIALNGSDSMRQFDGTTWSTVATLGALNTNTLIGLTSYQKRLFFVPNGSLSFWYLGAGAISGTATEFSLGQLCQKGGTLTALGTLTIDAGEGSDDHLVAVTSEGEVIVYKGTDPSNAAAWELVGVYFIGRPLGRRCMAKYGGDLLILTERGLWPMTKALQSATIDKTIALSDKIDQVFADFGRQYFSTYGWEIQIHTNQSFLFVNVPATPKQQFVMDLVTRGWSRFLGWSATCFAVYGGELYYGSNGLVAKAYTGQSDFGASIQCVMLTAYNYFNLRGQAKQIELMRPTFASSGPFSYSLALLTDFSRDIPAASLTAAATSAAVWDTSLWDGANWSADNMITKDWVGVANWPFYNAALSITVSTNNVTVQHVATDYKFIPSAPNDL